MIPKRFVTSSVFACAVPRTFWAAKSTWPGAASGLNPRRSMSDTADSTPRPEHLESTKAEPRQAEDAPYCITDVFPIAPAVKGLRLRPEATPVTYEAGQWLDFFTDVGVGGYSMTSAPDTSAAARRALAASGAAPPPAGHLDLAVKRSRCPPAVWVHEHAAPGVQVRVRVGGSFTLRNCGIESSAGCLDPSLKHIVLVAGGVGINPIYSMLLHLSRFYADGDGARSGSSAPPPPTITLLYSAPTRRDMAFVSELTALAKSDAFAWSVGAAGSSGDAGVRLPEWAAATSPAAAGASRALLSLRLYFTREDGGSPAHDLTDGSKVSVSFGRRIDGLAIASALAEARALRARLRVVTGGAADVAYASCGASGAAQRSALGGAGDAARAAALAASSDGVAVLLCGPPAMTDGIAAACASELGLAAEQVHYEKWW